MSAPETLAEFLPPYIAEVEELLIAARANLLAVEVGTRTGHPNPRAVRELFRGIHTIKGLSAMVDVEPIVQLAHLMEASLRAADRAGGQLSASAVELLLQGVLAIEQRVRSLAADKTTAPAPAALLDALEGLASDTPVPASAPAGVKLELEPALLAKLNASEREQLHQGVMGGRRAVRVDFAPSPAKAGEGLTITTVRERVGKVAELVKVVPISVPVSSEEPGGLIFALLLLTRETDAAIAGAAGTAESQVRFIAAPAGAHALAPAEDEVEPAGRQGVVRVDSARLDDALERVGAMVVSRSRLAHAVAALTASGANTRELVQILGENARLLRDMRASVLRLRMVRVGEILERLPLMVRGLRRSTGKQATLQLALGPAELDKAVGDRLFPAIVHLVRNAVDHAIEPPEERRHLGKPEEGTLRISCREQSSSRLELVIEDDGRGVDAVAVARRAGGPPPTTSEGLLELLCRPGLSTRDEVTTTSGRGMGMDIVKRIIVDQLGGELRMETQPGRGTAFTIRVPLTVSILDAFIFEAASERYAAAVSTIDELIEIDPARIVRGPAPGGSSGGAHAGMIERRGTAIPLLKLNAVLALGPGGAGSKGIVVHDRWNQPIAFAVDRMLSQQEVVIRPFEDPLIRVPGVAGATDLGDGRPTLVLDLIALGALSRPQRGEERER